MRVGRKASQAVLIVSLTTLGPVAPGWAFPLLQLDASNGVYNAQKGVHSAETIVATTSDFTLYALLNPKAPGSDGRFVDPDAQKREWFYISAAVYPGVAADQSGSGPTLGSFLFGGQTFDVTQDMTYGVPPLNDPAGQGFDSGDLQKHGVFPTYFTQFAFQFDPSGLKADPYNAQDHPGGFTTTSSADSFFYAMGFQVDTFALDPNYFIHFDLYSEKALYGYEMVESWVCNKTETQKVKVGNDSKGKPVYEYREVCTSWHKERKQIQTTTVTDLDIGLNAPFSHDVESGTRPVPEPGTMLLLGTGLLGMGAALKNRSRKGLT